MTTNVVYLPGSSTAHLGEPNEALIEGLENLLKRAKSGQLQSMVATGFCSDGCRMTAWLDDRQTDIYQMLGAIYWLAHEYTNRKTI